MFGRHRHWEDAEAMVVSADNGPYTSWKIGQWSYCKFDLVLDVRPANGQMFRTAAVARFPTLYGPDAGDVIRVRFDPASHEVEVITEGDPRYDVDAKAQYEQQLKAAQRAQDLAAPPGTPPAGSRRGPSDLASTFGLDPELAELMRLEEEERRRHLP